MGASETVRSLIRLESIPRAFGAVALILLMYFFSELFRIRMKFRRMAKKHGIVSQTAPRDRQRGEPSNLVTDLIRSLAFDGT